MFGEQRLLILLEQPGGSSASVLIRRIHDALDGYVADAEVTDDITLLVLHHRRQSE